MKYNNLKGRLNMKNKFELISYIIMLVFGAAARRP